MRVNKTYLARKAKGAKRRLGAATQLSETLVPSSSSDTPKYGNGNKVINHPKLDRAKIIFKGKNNILYCEDPNTILSHGMIVFEGDNGVVYLSKHHIKDRKHRFKIYVKDGCAVHIGKDVNFHLGGDNMAYIAASEGKNVIIGDDCLFSLNLWIRTSDGHAAYDSTTKKHINPGKSVFIGDHVWLGQSVTVLKGSKIGSGSIVGAGSIVTGKTLGSNSSCAGAPAKELRQGVFFAKANINGYTDEQMNEIATCDTDEWIYSYDKSTASFDDIDTGLLNAKTSEDKLAYIKKHLAAHHSKNRFYVGKENYPPKK